VADVVKAVLGAVAKRKHKTPGAKQPKLKGVAQRSAEEKGRKNG